MPGRALEALEEILDGELARKKLRDAYIEFRELWNSAAVVLSFESMYARIIRSLRHRLGYLPRLVTVGLGGHKVKVREGLMMPTVDKDDGWIAGAILDSEVFLDLGCNVGFWTLYAAVTSINRIVIAWDTNAAALGRCAENLFLNGISHQARFVLGFASAESGQELSFYTVGTGSAGSRYPGHARTASGQNSCVLVRTLTIDGIVKQLGITPDLVKVDIEGAESEALEGAKELARNARPRFCVEMHSPPELPMVENCRRVLAWCRQAGYRAYYLKEHIQITTPEPVAHRGRCHLLLIPEEAEYPVWMRTIQEYSSIEQGALQYQAHQEIR